jgi:hypothetical protein
MEKAKKWRYYDVMTINSKGEERSRVVAKK